MLHSPEIWAELGAGGWMWQSQRDHFLRGLARRGIHWRGLCNIRVVFLLHTLAIGLPFGVDHWVQQRAASGAHVPY